MKLGEGETAEVAPTSCSVEFESKGSDGSSSFRQSFETVSDFNSTKLLSPPSSTSLTGDKASEDETASDFFVSRS